MALTVTDSRKNKGAAPPPPNKIVTSSLKAAGAPSDLGAPGSAKTGVRPPPAAKVTPRPAIPLLLAAMLEEGVAFPTVEEFNDEAFEAQCYWVIARHDLGEARNWAGNEKSFETHLATYRKAGKPIGFLSEASTDPGEVSDQEAVSAHADVGDVTTAELAARLMDAVEAWFSDELEGPSNEVLAKAKSVNPALFEKCWARDTARAAGAPVQVDEKGVEVLPNLPETKGEGRTVEYGANDNEKIVETNPPEKTGKNKPRWSLQRRELAAKMVKEGAPLDAICSAVNMPVEMVQAYMEELGASVQARGGAVTVLAEEKPVEEKPVAPVAQVKVNVTLNPIDPPSAEILERALHEKLQPRWAPDGAQQPSWTTDRLIECYEALLHAAKWLKQNGVV